MPVSFSKNQPVSLRKGAVQSGAGLTSIAMGLGWDPVERSGWRAVLAPPREIDLDASCIMLSSDGQEVDSVWYRRLRSRMGAVRHSGDNLTGKGDGDNETIAVNLDSVPGNVNYLVFVVGSYSGQSFKDVANASCRVYDTSNGAKTVFGEFSLTALKDDHRGIVMAVVSRDDSDGWKITMIGDTTQDGRAYRDMLPAAVAAIQRLVL
ncbi:MAG: TerD family protein [Candidatus Woesebacteria bacterium]|jgi:tellurium resistance protein TerZ